MAFTDAQTGGVGYLAYAVESTPGGSGTPGTPITPNLFLPITQKKITPTFEMVKPEVMRNTRMTQAIMERARLKVDGKIDWMLNPTLGLEFFTSGLGASSNLSAGTATATTAPITTANGVSTITVAGTFTKGAWVYINTDNAGLLTANSEWRRVLPQSTTGTLVVDALVTNASATTGKYIYQPAQQKVANSLLSSSYINQLGTLTVENDFGNWAWRFPGVYVDSLDVQMGKDQVTVSAGLKGSANPIYESSGVSYAPSGETNGLRPLTGIDCFVTANGDPDATGTSSLRAALGVQDVKISFKNALLEEAAFNNSYTYLVFPGDKATCEIEFTEISTSKRPDVWNDLILNSTSTSFLAGAAKNYGTASSPNLGAVGFYVPTFKYSDAQDDEKIGSIDTWMKKGSALAPPGGPADYLQMFIITPS